MPLEWAKHIQSWWDIESRHPFDVCTDADSLAEKVTRASLEGKKSGFGSLTKQQLDDLAWAARWEASGAYIMAGMTYRLAWETHRLVKVALALFATTSALLLLGIGVLIFQ